MAIETPFLLLILLSTNVCLCEETAAASRDSSETVPSETRSKVRVIRNPMQINEQLHSLLEKSKNGEGEILYRSNLDQIVDQTVVKHDRGGPENLEDLLSVIKYEPQKIKRKKVKRKILRVVDDRQDTLGTSDKATGSIPVNLATYNEVPRRKEGKTPKIDIKPTQQYSRNFEDVEPTVSTKSERRKNVEASADPLRSVSPTFQGTRENSHWNLQPTAASRIYYIPSKKKRINYPIESTENAQLAYLTLPKKKRKKTQKRVVQENLPPVNDTDEKQVQNITISSTGPLSRNEQQENSEVQEKFDIIPRPFSLNSYPPRKPVDYTIINSNIEEKPVHEVTESTRQYVNRDRLPYSISESVPPTDNPIDGKRFLPYANLIRSNAITGLTRIPISEVYHQPTTIAETLYLGTNTYVPTVIVPTLQVEQNVRNEKEEEEQMAETIQNVRIDDEGNDDHSRRDQKRVESHDEHPAETHQHQHLEPVAREDKKHETKGNPKDEKYEKGDGSEHEEDHHKVHGDKGHKGYESWHEENKADKGYRDKESHNKEYDESEVEKKDHQEEGGYAEERERGEKGEKSAEFGEEGEHKKGHSTKGQHVVHKKDEFEKKTEFFDEFHEDGDTEKDGEFYTEHEWKKGGQEKKGHHDEADHEDRYGKEEKYQKGGHHNEDKGHENKEGQDEHHRYGKKYGKKEGHEEKKSWSYEKGDDGKDKKEKKNER